jgi:hypothetical protein
VIIADCPEFEAVGDLHPHNAPFDAFFERCEQEQACLTIRVKEGTDLVMAVKGNKCFGFLELSGGSELQPNFGVHIKRRSDTNDSEMGWSVQEKQQPNE